MVIGSETVSSFIASSAGARPGNALPNRMPTAMARKIHRGSQRSRVESRLATAGRLVMVVAVAGVIGCASPLLRECYLQPARHGKRPVAAGGESRVIR